MVLITPDALATVYSIPLTRVCDCGTYLDLRVLNTPAGYYLGFWCPSHGPYSRETSYMNEQTAELLLEEIRGEGMFIEDEVIDSIVE